MKYSGSSIITTRQVGSTATVIENDTTYTVTILKTRSKKVGAGSVTVEYLVSGFPNTWFPSAEVFDNATDAKAAITNVDATV